MYGAGARVLLVVLRMLLWLCILRVLLAATALEYMEGKLFAIGTISE